MVTVIADKEELPTPVNNGVTAGSNDNERPFQYIKDYQEVSSSIFIYSKIKYSLYSRWIFIGQVRVDLYHKNLSMMEQENLQ